MTADQTPRRVRSGWCLTARHGQACKWAGCECECHDEDERDD